MNCPFARDCDEVKELEARIVRLEKENGILRRSLAAREHTSKAFLERKHPSRRRREFTEVRYPGRPKGFPGITRPIPKPDLVLQAIDIDACPECGSDLEPIRIRRAIIEELPNLEPMRVIEFEEIHYRCIDCHSQVISRHPDCPPEGRFGKNVCVQTTLLKFKERLPERKIQAVLERQGLNIAPATVLDIHRRVSQWLKPEYERILSSIKRADVVYTDQTGIKVDGVQYWIWTFVVDEETLYAIRDSKGKDVLKEILGDEFFGTIVCDGWRSFHSFTKNIQRCWAHLLREADELTEEVGEARALSRGLHGIYNRLKIALEKKPPPAERKKLARNARMALKRWIDRSYKSAKVRKFTRKVRNGFEYWFTFVTNDRIGPTNNRAERALRELVVQRKIIGTLRNAKGTSIYETIMTLLATWEQRGLSLPEMLSMSLTQAWQKHRKS